MARDFSETKKRYEDLGADVRLMLAEDVLQQTRIRVDVRPISTDAVRDSHAWDQGRRRVRWDWGQIKRKLFTYGPRTLSLAFYAGYPQSCQLCGLAAAQVSPHAKWLSLTHIEGAPGDHPLKGQVLPMTLLGLHLFGALVGTEETARKMGLRVLNPLGEALDCYQRNGYTEVARNGKISYIIVKPPAEA